MTIEEKTVAAKSILNSFFGACEEQNFSVALHENALILTDKETNTTLTTSRLDIHLAYTSVVDGSTEVNEVDNDDAA